MENRYKFWTTQELRFMRQNIHLTDQQLADRLGRTKNGIKGARFRYGILKPEHTWHFSKYHHPHNKGKHLPGWRLPENCYKKGNLPHNTRKDYDISYRKDRRSGITYRFIRLAKSKWVLMHRWIWELQYGAVPKGHLITFRDKDPMNCALDNLECISRKEHVRRNHNLEKASVSMKKHWEWCRTKETYGIKTKRHYALNLCKMK